MLRSEDIPNHLQCPISGMIFLEPVTVMPSGHTYEKEMLETLINNAKKENKTPLCPITRKPILSYGDSWAMKAVVADYLKSNPAALDEQYKRKSDIAQNNVTNAVASASNSAAASSVAVLPFNDSDEESSDSDDLPLGWEDEMTASMRSSAVPRPLERVKSSSSEESSDSDESDSIVVMKSAAVSSSASQSDDSESDESDSEESVKPAKKKANTKLPTQEDIFKLNPIDEKSRAVMIAMIKNVIFALGFEVGPPGTTHSTTFLSGFFATIVDEVTYTPAPWQEIRVNRKGPKSPEMYEVLKAAIRALNSVDAEILKTAKEKYKGKYDAVKTKLAGQVSLSDKYGFWALKIGTVQDQPGDVVRKTLSKVEKFLKDLYASYRKTSKQIAYKHFGDRID